MYQVIIPIEWPSRVIPATINYPDVYEIGAEITVGYQGLLTKVFLLSENYHWIFNPESLPYCPGINCYDDSPLFFLESEVLWHILTNEPFALPLIACNGCGCCCQKVPGLTYIEAKTILEIHGSVALDLDGNAARLSKRDWFCYFFDKVSGKCLLHGEDYRPHQCQWLYCQSFCKIGKIKNYAAIIDYLEATFPDAPSSLILDLVPQ